MLKKEIIDLINTQIEKEYESAYLYLYIANYYEEKGLHGFAHWFKKQASEEREHAEKFSAYLAQEGAHIELHDIKASTLAFKDFREPLVEQLAHEKLVTSLIDNIYETALKINDHRTALFLHWFINEQAEEETTATALLEKYAAIGECKTGLYLMDKDLAAR